VEPCEHHVHTSPFANLGCSYTDLVDVAAGCCPYCQIMLQIGQSLCGCSLKDGCRPPRSHRHSDDDEHYFREYRYRVEGGVEGLNFIWSCGDVFVDVRQSHGHNEHAARTRLSPS